MWRPILADPPLCTLAEVRSTLTLDDLLNLAEALDLREHMQARAAKAAEERARRR